MMDGFSLIKCHSRPEQLSTKYEPNPAEYPMEQEGQSPCKQSHNICGNKSANENVKTYQNSPF